MSSYASDAERVKTYAPTSLSFRMMDCRMSSTRLPAANVTVKRLLTAARLKPSPLSKSDLAHDVTHFFVHPSNGTLGPPTPPDRAVSGWGVKRASQTAERRRRGSTQ